MLEDIQAQLNGLLDLDLNALWDTNPVYLVGAGLLFVYLFFMLASGANVAREKGMRQTAGWTIPAQRKKHKKQPDGSMSEKLILRPSYRRNVFLTVSYYSCWAVMFLATGFIMAMDAPGPEHFVFLSLAFIVSLLFAIRLLKNSRRIEVLPDKIVDRSPLKLDRTYRLSDIHSLEPLKKKFQFGTRLRFANGRILTVRASFEGYRDLLVLLSKTYPQISKVINAAPPPASP